VGDVRTENEDLGAGRLELLTGVNQQPGHCSPVAGIGVSGDGVEIARPDDDVRRVLASEPGIDLLVQLPEVADGRLPAHPSNEADASHLLSLMNPLT
jgi:hypothetical protein